MRIFSLIFFCLVGNHVLAQSFTQTYVLEKLENVNTFYHDAAPVISPDGTELYFFIQNHPENTHGRDGSQDIWVSRKDQNGVWGSPTHLGSPFNQNRSNQVFNVLPDGSLFIRGTKRRDQKGFSIVSKDGSNWTELEVENYEDMEKGRFSGATISQNKQHMILYFSEYSNSIRCDLYISHAQPNGSWSRPIKMNIADNSDEFGPFIGPDNMTLYYASDRNDSDKQGGTDIYKSERLDESWDKWSAPVNVGSTINTAANDSYFSIDATGHVFSSRSNSRIDGGNLDIFKLVPRDVFVTVTGTIYNANTNQPISADVVFSANDTPQNLKTDSGGSYSTQLSMAESFQVSATATGYFSESQLFPVPEITHDTTLQADLYLVPEAKKMVLTGTVFNTKTGEPVTASILVDRPAGEPDVTLKANNGNYQNEVESTGWYLMTATAEGFLNTTDSIRINDLDQERVIKDLYLQPIEVGVTVRLKNIYFDFDRTTLKQESFVELDKVVDFLKQNGQLEIEIAGHTDDKGSDVYNQNLSQGRSQAVVDYLIGKGIDSFRLSAHGYGESNPIDTNNTDDGRANNRRVEFTVLRM